MSTIIEPSKGTAPQIDDGLFTVTCTGVRSITVDNDAFGNFEKIELALQIQGVLDENGDAMTLDPRVNRKWNEKSTLFKYAVAFGVVASPSEPFDAEDLIGKKAQALIETPAEGGWPRVTKMTALKPRKAGQVDDDGVRRKAQEAPSEARAPWESTSVDEDTVSQFWEATLGVGFKRPDVLAACATMFEGRNPGQLTVMELHALTDKLNETA